MPLSIIGNLINEVSKTISGSHKETLDAKVKIHQEETERLRIKANVANTAIKVLAPIVVEHAASIIKSQIENGKIPKLINNINYNVIEVLPNFVNETKDKTIKKLSSLRKLDTPLLLEKSSREIKLIEHQKPSSDPLS